MVKIEFLSVVKSIVEMFYSIPPVIWSGVIGSMLALSGVYLTSKNSYKNLKMQLMHDSKERLIERSTKLRQESYSLVAKELVSAQQHLANLPMTEIFKENPASGIDSFLKASTQCQLVASSKTAMLMLKYTHGFSKITLRALASVDNIANASNAAALAKESIEKNQIEFDRTMLKATEFNQEIGSEKANFEVLMNYMEFYKDNMDKGWADNNAALNEKAKHTLTYSRNLLNDLVSLTSDQVDVLVSMRADLGFDSDLEEYRKLLLEQQQEMLKEIEESFAKITSETF